MTILLYAIILSPFILGMISFALHKKYAKTIMKLSPIVLLVMLLLVVFMVSQNVHIANDMVFFHSDFLLLSQGGTYLPHINVAFSLMILILGAIIGLYTIPYLTKELHHKVIGLGRVRRYNFFINMFIFSMLAVSFTSNVMIMWIGLEATTIFTTFLISFYNTKTTREAAWKYVVLCGIGLTIGLFGILMIIYGGLQNLTFFDITLGNVNPLLVKLGFVLVFIGIGTKATFFPSQTRLPDAHGKTTTPVSAFMSSILLPLALYMIFRIKVITDTLLGDSHFTNMFFLIFGLLTVLYTSIVLLKQSHFKRTLAYSSSENIGIMAIALGISSPFSMMLFVVHLIAHGFFKTASFMSVGNVMLHTHTGQFHKIKKLTNSMKITPILMIISLLLLVGVPLSPIFFTEIGIVFALLSMHRIYATVFILSMIFVFSGIVRNFARLFHDKDTGEVKPVQKETKFGLIHIPIILSIIFGIVGICLVFFIK